MKLVLTDSGLGGLSVLAHLTEILKQDLKEGDGSVLHLTYVNAVPRHDYGYNEMPSKEERIKIFNGVLESVKNF